jgi:antirestriction protein ArdC
VRITQPGIAHGSVLKDDKRAIFSAAAHAQRAADYLNGLQPGAQQEAAE